MSYIPAGNNVNHWQSNAQSAGPVRANQTPAMRSGSRRSYAGNKPQDAVSGKTGQVIQGTVGQFGNYLLYKDAVNYQKQHAEAEAARLHDKVITKASGDAIGSMLGGPSVHSPGKKKVGGPGLGPPQPGNKGPLTPNPIGQAQAAWENERINGPRPGNPMDQAARMWNSQYGRTGFQPNAPQGNTATPQGPQANDPRVQRRAGGKIAGTLSNVEDYPAPKSSPFLGSGPKQGENPTIGQGRLFDPDDPWQM